MAIIIYLQAQIGMIVPDARVPAWQQDIWINQVSRAFPTDIKFISRVLRR